jgi:hypothetical protein
LREVVFFRPCALVVVFDKREREAVVVMVVAAVMGSRMHRVAA